MQKVSAIIPVYNAEKYIEKCINSVLSQSYKNIELILVNDGSTDNSLNIIKKYDALIIDKHNGGASSARNAGIKEASGDYIMFLDSDDYIDSDAIEKMLGGSDDITKIRLKYEYAGGTQKLGEAYFKGGELIEKKDFKKKIYTKFLSGIKLNSVVGTLFKAELVKDLQFDTSLKTGEDLVFALEAYTRAKSFLYIDDVFYYYYQSGNGLTGSGIGILEKYKCNFIAGKFISSYLKKWDMYSLKYRFIVKFRILLVTVNKIKNIILK